MIGATVAGWAVGLGWMWAAKWALALAVRRTATGSSTASATRSSSGPGVLRGCHRHPCCTGFTKNVEYLVERNRWLPSSCSGSGRRSGMPCGGGLEGGRRARTRSASAVSPAALARSSPFRSPRWYVVLNNHNQIHVLADVPLGGRRHRRGRRVRVRRRSAGIRRRSPNRSVATLIGIGDDEAITSEPSEEQDPTPQFLRSGVASPVEPNGSGP